MKRFEDLRWLFFDNHKFYQQLRDASSSKLFHPSCCRFPLFWLS